MPHNLTKLEDVASAGVSAWSAAPFLKKVTDIVPNVIYVFNQATQSNEYSNRSLASTLGYSVGQIQAMGADFLPALCHPDDLGKIVEHFEGIKSLADGEVLSVEYRIRHKFGYWVWLLSTDTVFDRDASGEVLRHIGVASDITAQKTAEEIARAETLKATTTSEELRAFSYSLSHDMKAPSNTLNLLLTELLDTHGAQLDDDATELINMSLATVGRMGRLVDEVLNYAQVVNQDFKSQPIALNQIVKDVLDDLHALIHLEGATLQVEELPVVRADQTQLWILIKNLIENAIKFHKPGVSPKVTVTASRDLDLTRCNLTIRDEGIGICANKHDDVFTIFKRLNAEGDFAGTGTGLAICRRIAANHGSTITVDSAPGRGAAFTIDLPLA